MHSLNSKLIGIIMSSRPLPKIEGNKVFELGVKSVKIGGQISTMVAAKQAARLN